MRPDRSVPLGRVQDRWSRPFRPHALALACALLGAVPAPAVGQDASPRREVADLRFEGARAFREEQLRSAIQTRESGCKVPVLCLFGIAREPEYIESPTALETDVIRLRYFYFQRGYREAHVAVDTLPREDGVRVVFTIDEGRPVRVASLDVQAAAGFLPDDIARRLPLRTGDPLNLRMVEASRDSLISALRDRGYPRADVLIDQIRIPAESYEADVSFVVIPGTQARFGPIEITGDDRISESIIRRMLTFREGDLYRQSALLASQRNLFGLNVFQNVSIRPVDDPASDGVVPVRIQVNEGDLHRLRLGAGGNSQDCVNGEARWVSRNFLGGARRLEVRGLVTNVLAEPLSKAQLGNARLCKSEDTLDEADLDLAGSLSADFTQPWLFGPRNTLGAGLFVERRNLPGVFTRHARGAYLTLTRTISARTSLSLGFRPERTSLDAVGGDLVFCESLIACAVDPDERGVLTEPHWLNPVTLSFTRDRTNSIFFPSRGYILRLETEYASAATASDFEYGRATGDLSWYRAIANGVILATRLRGGWARSIEEPGAGLGLNPQKRFFAGGANSVRGYAQYGLGPKVLRADAEKLVEPLGTGAGCTAAQVNAGTCDPSALDHDDFDDRPVGGDALLEGSIELRFPVYGAKWRGAAFVDFGQVWQTEAERGSDTRVDLAALVFTPGLGIRYNSPIGPIRVDVAYNPPEVERLRVITTSIGESERRVVELQRRYDWNPRQNLRDRFQFHFSIGQAF